MRLSRWESHSFVPSSILEHEMAIDCKVFGHAGLVPVAHVLSKGDRTVAELAAAARCSRCRCRAKIVGTYRFVYGGQSDIAITLTGQMPHDGWLYLDQAFVCKGAVPDDLTIVGARHRNYAGGARAVLLGAAMPQVPLGLVA